MIFGRADVLKLCTHSDGARKVLISKKCLSETPSLEEACCAWFVDMVFGLPVKSEQRHMVMDEFLPDVASFAKSLNEYIELSPAKLQLPVAYLGLGDRRYVAMTGRADMYDVNTGERTDMAKSMFLETIQYNLTTLFTRKYQALLELAKGVSDASSGPPEIAEVE